MTRSTLSALFLMALPLASIHAQPADIGVQQANLQALLDQAIAAIRNNDQATACQLRAQALGILAPNLNAFISTFPANDWSDLQSSLQDSVNSCQAKGL